MKRHHLCRLILKTKHFLTKAELHLKENGRILKRWSVPNSVQLVVFSRAGFFLGGGVIYNLQQHKWSVCKGKRHS